MADEDDEPSGFTSADARPKGLAVVQPTSDLLAEHPEWRGKYVYNREALLGSQITFTILKTVRVYAEDKKWVRGQPIAKWFRLSEAKAWSAKTGGKFKEQAYVVVAVELSEDQAEKLSVPVRRFPDGEGQTKTCLIAAWDLRGSFFSIIGDEAEHLDSPGRGGKWYTAATTYSSKQVTNDRGTFMVPVSHGRKLNSKEFVEAVEATALTK